MMFVPKKVPGLSCHGSQCHGRGTNVGFFEKCILRKLPGVLSQWLVEANLLKGSALNCVKLSKFRSFLGWFVLCQCFKSSSSRIGNAGEAKMRPPVPRACKNCKNSKHKIQRNGVFAVKFSQGSCLNFVL